MRLIDLVRALNQLGHDGASPDDLVFTMKPVEKYDGGEMPFEIESVYKDSEGKIIIT